LSDPETTLDHVVLGLTWLQLEFGRQPTGDHERVSLIGAVRAEPWTDRLRAVDHSRTIRAPRRRNDVG